MDIISWNVNGVRAWMQKDDTNDFIENRSPDIFCIQETKADKYQVYEFFEKKLKRGSGSGDKNNVKNKSFLSDYSHHFWNSADKKGYSGTAVFSKIKPTKVRYGLQNQKDESCDTEGRVITAEFENFFLVNVYTPNSKQDLSRLGYRYDEWDKAMLSHITRLEEVKPVILCGDMNVAHEEIDIARPRDNETTETSPGSPGFTDKERERFRDFLDAGFIDTFRFLHPEEITYSWWSYRNMARERNVGWRLDYFLVSSSLGGNVKKAEIFDMITGSDHCPVFLEI